MTLFSFVFIIRISLDLLLLFLRFRLLLTLLSFLLFLPELCVALLDSLCLLSVDHEPKHPDRPAELLKLMRQVVIGGLLPGESDALVVKGDTEVLAESIEAIKTELVEVLVKFAEVTTSLVDKLPTVVIKYLKKVLVYHSLDIWWYTVRQSIVKRRLFLGDDLWLLCLLGLLSLHALLVHFFFCVLEVPLSLV